MEMDRKTVVELAVSVFIIVGFTAVAYVVSQTYASPVNGTTNNTVPPSVEPAGGIALVATIGGFILAVAVVGFILYRADLDDD